MGLRFENGENRASYILGKNKTKNRAEYNFRVKHYIFVGLKL